MSLDENQKVTKIALERIYSNAKLGIIAHFVVMVFITGILSFSLPFELLLLGAFLHFFLLSRRTHLMIKFNKIKETLLDYKDIEKWLSKYRTCMLFSGLSFGSILFLFPSLPAGHHFLILSILVGLAAGAIYTIGEIFSIYLSYLGGILGVSLFWMILQDGDIYSIASILIIVVLFFFGSTSYRYSNNFRQVILKERKANQHIFEQKEAQDKILEQKNTLEYQAHYDSLTTLPNRVLFYDRLGQGIEQAKRNGTILALYFIDLDNFKVINDSFGHDEGDRVLNAVTSRLKDAIRSHDTLSRVGGDEFTVILEDLHDVQAASMLAQKILKILSEPFLIGQHTFYISCSIGISLSPKDTTDPDSLIKYADSAMYKAKDDGKNSYAFYSSEMTKFALDRVVMEAAIREGIINEEFVVFYQPQIDARDNKLIGMEALVRWNNPKLGLVAPFKFIPLAEETGMIVEIDKLVMNIAMKQFSEWYEKGYNPGALSLNLAMKHLAQKDYIEKLQDAIVEYSFNTQYLELELLENDIMKNPEDSISKLNEISSLGIKIAIDDFGTGYSSLAYLKKLPIHKLKIDKSFVDDILEDEDEDGRAIVKAVIALATTLNLNIIAEGVENEEQKDFLLGHGCRNIQGYYYSKPIPADEMQEFMIKTQL